MIFTATGLGSGDARSLWGVVSVARRFSAISVLLGALFVCSFHQAASSAPINYGSHTGTTVSYIDVSEEATTSDSLPLFGAPIFSADSIDFNPVGFDAAASGPGGSDSTGSRLTFMVVAHPGFAINNIAFQEAGQTTLSGSGTDSTSAVVTADGTVTISHVDGAAITPIVRPIALTFAPSGGSYGLATDGGGLPIFHTPWSGALAVNFAQILTQEGVPFVFGPTKVSVDLENTLTATSEDGTQSLISKKDFGGISITINIPEPGSLVLAGLGLAGVWGVRRGRGRC